jgi:hypothetical protein
MIFDLFFVLYFVFCFLVALFLITGHLLHANILTNCPQRPPPQPEALTGAAVRKGDNKEPCFEIKLFSPSPSTCHCFLLL